MLEFCLRSILIEYQRRFRTWITWERCAGQLINASSFQLQIIEPFAGGVMRVPTNAFRADQIGSLLRPEPLLEPRDRFLGELDAKRLEEMEDAAILKALAKQKEWNIDVWRTGFMTNFTDSVHGFESAAASAQSGAETKATVPRLIYPSSRISCGSRTGCARRTPRS